MKKILFSLLILSTVSIVSGQSVKSVNEVSENRNGSNLKLAVSINPGLLFNIPGSAYALGGELSLYKTIKSELEAAVSAGFTGLASDGLIHVKPGIRYSLTQEIYAGAQIGAAISTTEGGIYVVYSPTIGWKMSDRFDAGLKYDHVGNGVSVLGLNLRYRIGL